jgi:hypothetical protein
LEHNVKVRCSSIIALLLLTIGPVASQQPSAQNPSPMVDHTRPHPRITQTEAKGRRVELKSLKGARLFVSPRFNPNRPAPLLIHFHGAPWLIEQHVASHLPRAALITVQLGAGSSAYRRPFEQAELFRASVEEASRELNLRRGWSSVTLTAFSAGYGAVREILRRPEYFAMVNNVLLLDGMHTSYIPEAKPLADGGTLDSAGLDVFVTFAREAVAGKKSFVFTHSETFPGTFASTTECAEYTLAQLRLQRRAELRQGPMGMQQVSAVNAGRFHLRGYAGNSAPDHVDHLHAMPAWFPLLQFK